LHFKASDTNFTFNHLKPEVKMSRNIKRREFIKTGLVISAGIVAGCSLRNRFDIIIKNGMVSDGSGNPFAKTDLGIKGERITAMADLSTASADDVIDASGLMVSPGFIDIHTHTDTELLVNPNAESKIHQGITTEVSGNCGYSPFPLNDNDFGELDEELFTKKGYHITWRNIEGFLKALEERKISLNYVTLTGHGMLRSFVVGRNDVAPTAQQMETMKKLLEDTLQNGSFGLSTGLEYAPGSYAKTGELIELSRVVSRQGGIYATHMRNEDDRVEEAVQEALDICREAEVSLQISHLKACNKNNWHKVDHLLEMIRTASEKGMPVHADRYPYNAWSTGLSALLPLWAREGETREMMARLLDPEVSPKIKEYAENRARNIGGWDRLVINSCFSEENKQFEGKSILEGSESSGLSPFEFIKKLMIEEKSRVDIMGFAMDEGNLKKVLASPLVMVGSDGSAVAPYGKLAEGKPHPRFYGTFPRVLGKYSREEQLFRMETAIKKMTSQPADKLGLKQRGRLQNNYYADVVIFNPATVIDRATYVAPHQYPEGIEYVIVNGKITIRQGEHTGAHAGRVLRRA
jgi:N-acyl-D-amino-acid deacylase